MEIRLLSPLPTGPPVLYLPLARPLNGGHVANSGSGDTSTSTNVWGGGCACVCAYACVHILYICVFLNVCVFVYANVHV